MYASSPGGSASVNFTTDWQVTKQTHLELLAGPIWATSASDKPIRMFTNQQFTPGPVVRFKNEDKFLGWEIDLRATHRIYSNLILALAAAYFIAEDGMDHATTIGVPVARKEADDAYKLTWRLVYEF
jgi:hypothetical protein